MTFTAPFKLILTKFDLSMVVKRDFISAELLTLDWINRQSWRGEPIFEPYRTHDNTSLIPEALINTGS
jgi:hypothetical protein